MLSLLLAATVQLPVPFCWQFDAPTLTNRTYIADLDYLKANTEAELMLVAPVSGVAPEGNRLFHDALKELVSHAHDLGIRIVLRSSPGTPDFFSPEPKGLIPEPENAQGLTYDAEAVLDADGRATFTEEARWARPKKVKPLRNDVVGAWVFEKTNPEKGDGFYRKGTLVDVTERVKVVNRTSDRQTVRVEAGREHAGKTVFLVTVQYFNASDLFSGAMWRWHKQLMDELADIPLDGFCMDEQGYILFAFTPNGGGVGTESVGNKYDAFRFRYYTPAMARHFRERLNVDLKRLLFDMRYAPEGEEAIRIRAINRFWREVQAQPTVVENQVADYQRKLWGTNCFLCCHSTFHNTLDGDDAWRTGNDWWDLPRDYGFTDECTEMPLRMGVLCATPSKPHFGYNMFYSKDPAQVYWNMALCAPFNLREFHHSFNDGFWGLGYREQPFTSDVRKFDLAIRPLDEFQKDVFPKLDLLVVFGTAAQVNWYPDRAARNVWDVDGAMKVQQKADALWQADYRCALVPDKMIDDGRLVLKDGKYVLNGHAFSHAIFLYPKYATKKTYAFLNAANDAKMPLVVVGRADIDFDAEPASFGGLRVDAFSTDLAAKIGCPKSAIPGGCVYDDGSFCLVSEAVVTGETTTYDFMVNGRRFRGAHTGVFAWRDGKVVYATPGWTMSVEDALPNEDKAYGAVYADVVDRFRLWPELAPHETADDGGRYVFDERIKVWRRRDVTCPEVVLLKPREVKSDALVIVMPGGGYDSQHMGHLTRDAKPILDSGRWVAVLHYRIPRRSGRNIYDAPREDAARAIRLLRASAAKYGWSPEKIGALGFSAGAHLTAISATSSQDLLYPRVDSADDISPHLNFAIPVYPAYVAEDGATGPNAHRGDDAKILPEFKFDAKTPPMFMLHGDDDYYSSMASVLLYAELHKRKIPAQLFVFSHASHGLSDKANARGWQSCIVKWLDEMGF